MATNAGYELLIAAGSGIAPIMSMLRHRAFAAPGMAALLLYFSRTIQDVVFLDELSYLEAASSGLSVIHSLTRAQPDGWIGFDRRLDHDMITEVLYRLGMPAHAYVCGPGGFVEVARTTLERQLMPSCPVYSASFDP